MNSQKNQVGLNSDHYLKLCEGKAENFRFVLSKKPEILTHNETFGLEKERR